MRSFILGAVVCLGTLLVGAKSASAQVFSYTTPYSGFSYGVTYPGTYGYNPYYSSYLTRQPWVSGYTPYSSYNYYPAYPGYYNGWTTGYRYNYSPYYRGYGLY